MRRYDEAVAEGAAVAAAGDGGEAAAVAARVARETERAADRLKVGAYTRPLFGST